MLTNTATVSAVVGHPDGRRGDTSVLFHAENGARILDLVHPIVLLTFTRSDHNKRFFSTFHLKGIFGFSEERNNAGLEVQSAVKRICGVTKRTTIQQVVVEKPKPKRLVFLSTYFLKVTYERTN